MSRHRLPLNRVSLRDNVPITHHQTLIRLCWWCLGDGFAASGETRTHVSSLVALRLPHIRDFASDMPLQWSNRTNLSVGQIICLSGAHSLDRCAHAVRYTDTADRSPPTTALQQSMSIGSSGLPEPKCRVPSSSPCCSQYSNCGSTSDFCGTGCDPATSFNGRGRGNSDDQPAQFVGPTQNSVHATLWVIVGKVPTKTNWTPTLLANSGIILSNRGVIKKTNTRLESSRYRTRRSSRPEVFGSL
ncbi:hypothetical protein BC938DRAFT_471905 [Jimgerdemannia flammicorona]|uniref:Chitin-binding type-1 domain-containing protein n=1 Tax=Jimgerdemannia flammicorona TaxID=994334 RepID=A0A433Q754_9FUNG|nr:hypothetical protein BC938DRAFT_471905 [Jimgerdemannia flammicorona]